MERIYELETGDFIDLDTIISVGKIISSIGGFKKLPIKCKLSKEKMI